MSSRSRSRRSSSRRSRSPLKRRAPLRERRSPSKREEARQPRKRTRLSSRTRIKSPPRKSSGERRRYYSPRNDGPSSKPRASSVSLRDEVDERYDSDKYVVSRPTFRGPDILPKLDSLKTFNVEMRDIPVGNDGIKREIVNAEDITVVRRAGEGSRPIFDRDEIKNHSLRHEEHERERSKAVSAGLAHLGRRRFRSKNPTDSQRSRDLDEERSLRERDYPPARRSRDIRQRSPGPSWRSRSKERSREYPPDRGDRYDDGDGHRSFRRTPERGRSDERILRRHPSPGDSRRSTERRDAHFRNYDVPPHGDGFASASELAEGAAYDRYYEREGREGGLGTRPRGHGRGLSLRGRGIPAARTYARPAEIIVCPVPPAVWPVRPSRIPRGRGTGRMPFPPRLGSIVPGSIVRPVIRIITPVAPVAPSIIPVRPHPAMHVRHPVFRFSA